MKISIFILGLLGVAISSVAAQAEMPRYVQVGQKAKITCGGHRITGALFNPDKAAAAGFKVTFPRNDSVVFSRTEGKKLERMPDTYFFYCQENKEETRVHGVVIFPFSAPGQAVDSINLIKKGVTPHIESVAKTKNGAPVGRLPEVVLSATDVNVVKCAGTHTGDIIFADDIFDAKRMKDTWAIKFKGKRPDLYKEVATKIYCGTSNQTTTEDFVQIRFVPKRIPGQLVELKVTD